MADFEHQHFYLFSLWNLKGVALEANRAGVGPDVKTERIFSVIGLLDP